MASVFGRKSAPRDADTHSRPPARKSCRGRVGHNARVNPRKHGEIAVIHTFHRVFHRVMSTK